MIPVQKIISYFNSRKAFIRSLILSLGMVLVLFSSFVPQNRLNNNENKSGWLTPSASGMEKLVVYKDAGDPNSDLHLSCRKQTKVKSVKKLTPNTLAAERAADADDISSHPVVGFNAVKRPAYYIFLFRYTLF